MLSLKILVLLLNFTSSLALNFFDRNPIYGFECNAFSKLIVDIDYHYFLNQHSIAIIDFSRDSAATSMICSENNEFMPLYVFSDPWRINLGAEVDSSSLSSFNTKEGIIFKTPSVKIELPMDIISSHNPRARLMIILVGNSSTLQEYENAKQILEKAFHEFKMVNVAVMLVIDEHEDGKYLGTKISVAMYNPFSGSENARKPEFIHLIFNFSNVVEQIQRMKQFIDLRVKNLHGYPLRISIFRYPMISMPVMANGKVVRFSFVDGETITLMSKYLNFTPTYKTPKKNDFKYGIQKPNGTFDGSLGDVEYGLADLAANPKLIANYSTTKSVFLQPLTTTTLAFIIPKRKTYKYLIFAVFQHFDFPTKLVCLILIIIFPIVYAIINRCEQRIFHPSKRTQSVGGGLLFVWAILNSISMKLSKLPSTRIVIAFILFFALVFSSIFQSIIVKNLNSNQVLGKITKIEELVNEGYKIRMPDYVATMFKTPGIDKVSWMLNVTKTSYLSAAYPFYDFKQIFRPSKKTAFLWTNLYHTSYLDRFYNKTTGENLYESVPEVAFEFFIAMMAPKNSPFIESFNEFLIQFSEIGLANYFLARGYDKNELIMIQRIRNGHVPKPRDLAIKYSDLSLCFEAFLWLCLTAIAIFSAELAFKYLNGLLELRTKKKNER